MLPEGRAGCAGSGILGNIAIHRLETGTIAAGDRDIGDLAEIDQNFMAIEPGSAGDDETGH
jgi:hypothetical protein